MWPFNVCFVLYLLVCRIDYMKTTDSIFIKRGWRNCPGPE